jgi:transcription elongation factor Elf1
MEDSVLPKISFVCQVCGKHFVYALYSPEQKEHEICNVCWDSLEAISKRMSLRSNLVGDDFDSVVRDRNAPKKEEVEESEE